MWYRRFKRITGTNFSVMAVISPATRLLKEIDVELNAPMGGDSSTGIASAFPATASISMMKFGSSSRMPISGIFNPTVMGTISVTGVLVGMELLKTTSRV